MSVAKTFIDSNVLIYAVDDRDPRKRDAARKVIGELAHTGAGHISIQVLNEFANNMIRKFQLSPAQARGLCDNLSNLVLEVPTRDHVNEALRIMGIASLSYYDASILAAAKLAGCKALLSGDMPTGQVIEGVQIINPF